MIKLSFSIGREVFNIYIDGVEIWYSDRRWVKGIRCIPKDKDFIQRVRLSRNKLPNFLIDLFNLTDMEKKEYEDSKLDEEKLADMVIRDCKKVGAKLLRRW